MKVTAYLLCWNEIDIAKLVILHYQRFCDRVVILDNYSTDGTPDLAKSMGCDVIPFGTKFFDDHENRDTKNSIWKGDQSDWIVIADFDECLWSSDIKEAFSIATGDGKTIFNTYGWQIMSDQMPVNDLLEITQGYHFGNYSKKIVFDPKTIHEINYGFGAHECRPEGIINYADEELFVLHYKHIGGLQRTIDRYKEYKKRMSKNNRQFGHGIHYNRSAGSLRVEWAERMAKSRPLI